MCLETPGIVRGPQEPLEGDPGPQDHLSPGALLRPAYRRLQATESGPGCRWPPLVHRDIPWVPPGAMPKTTGDAWPSLWTPGHPWVLLDAAEHR